MELLKKTTKKLRGAVEVKHAGIKITLLKNWHCSVVDDHTYIMGAKNGLGALSLTLEHLATASPRGGKWTRQAPFMTTCFYGNTDKEWTQLWTLSTDKYAINFMYMTVKGRDIKEIGEAQQIVNSIEIEPGASMLTDHYALTKYPGFSDDTTKTLFNLDGGFNIKWAIPAHWIGELRLQLISLTAHPDIKFYNPFDPQAEVLKWVKKDKMEVAEIAGDNEKQFAKLWKGNTAKECLVLMYITMGGIDKTEIKYAGEIANKLFSSSLELQIIPKVNEIAKRQLVEPV